MNEARDHAALYISFGWYPIPLKGCRVGCGQEKHAAGVHGTKECRDSNWKVRIYRPEDFEEGDNVGIRLVKESDERSKKLVAVDLDAPECVALADKFLPPSSASWGRPSKNPSQILYLSSFERPITIKDENTTLVEIRVDHQSMAPPSIHPNGEKLAWIGDKIDAPEVDPGLLSQSVRMLATAALVARHYPSPGARHEWCLYLSGTLRHLGMGEEEAGLIVSSAASVVGDKKVKDRLTEVRTTFAKNDDDPVGGSIKLEELGGKALVEGLRRIWGERSIFVLDSKGRPIKDEQANIRRALESLGVKLSFNDFTKTMLITVDGRTRELDDEALVHYWLAVDSKFRFKPSKDFFYDVLSETARREKFHPVLNYLEGLTWDGTPRVDSWLTTYGKATERPLTSAVGSLVLRAAVARVVWPGAKFDELLVLESPQGKNKSTALRTLCPDESWFSDDLPLDIDAKQIIERTAGKWIVEAAELSGMRRSRVEHLKAFLSRQVDGPVRLAYARGSTKVERQFVIVGTTNSHYYLHDEDNRRFWPVRCGAFDIVKLKEDRDQLWAEAYCRRQESIRLTQSLWSEAKKVQEARRTVDPWEEKIESQFGEKQRVTSDEIWAVLGRSLDQRNRFDSDRVSEIMQRLGFEKRVVREGKVVHRAWCRALELET